MDDGGEGMLGRDAGQQCGQGVAVGGVAGGDGDLGAQLGQVRAESVGAAGVGPAAAGEQQVPYAVPLDQVPGDQTAQGRRCRR